MKPVRARFLPLRDRSSAEAFKNMNERTRHSLVSLIAVWWPGMRWQPSRTWRIGAGFVFGGALGGAKQAGAETQFRVLPAGTDLAPVLDWLLE
jgi:hypothetical protein